MVIQPDNEVEHGRAESRFFPCWASKGPLKAEEEDGKAASEELELPNTPNKGAYYIEGMKRIEQADSAPLPQKASKILIPYI